MKAFALGSFQRVLSNVCIDKARFLNYNGINYGTKDKGR